MAVNNEKNQVIDLENRVKQFIGVVADPKSSDDDFNEAITLASDAGLVIENLYPREAKQIGKPIQQRLKEMSGVISSVLSSLKSYSVNHHDGSLSLEFENGRVASKKLIQIDDLVVLLGGPRVDEYGHYYVASMLVRPKVHLVAQLYFALMAS